MGKQSLELRQPSANHEATSLKTKNQQAESDREERWTEPRSQMTMMGP